MTQSKQAQAAVDLLVLAEELGGLPLPIEEILRLEALGATVDLTTGEIDWMGAERWVDLTVVGEAIAYLLEVER